MRSRRYVTVSCRYDATLYAHARVYNCNLITSTLHALITSIDAVKIFIHLVQLAGKSR